MEKYDVDKSLSLESLFRDITF